MYRVNPTVFLPQGATAARGVQDGPYYRAIYQMILCSSYNAHTDPTHRTVSVRTRLKDVVVNPKPEVRVKGLGLGLTRNATKLFLKLRECTFFLPQGATAARGAQDGPAYYRAMYQMILYSSYDAHNNHTHHTVSVGLGF